MKFRLKIWRQAGPDQEGGFEEYTVDNILPEMSFLEMLDQLNEDLIRQDKDPVAFDSDCREGICGTCGLVIDGMAHGPELGCTTCELRMREFPDGALITVEPFRADAFPVIKDLVVDRRRWTGSSPPAATSRSTPARPRRQRIPIPKDIAEEAMDAAACIGCGACVAACPNASASLFTGAKISQLALLPKAIPNGSAASSAWSTRWTPKGSAAAPTTENAKPPAPRASRSSTSPGCAGSTSRQAGRRPRQPIVVLAGSLALLGLTRPDLTGLSVGVPIRAAYIALSRTGSIRVRSDYAPATLAGVLLSPCFFTLLLVNQDAKRPGYAS